MSKPLERKSRTCRSNFCPIKAPSCAFPGFTNTEERAEQPHELSAGPEAPEGPCVPSPLPWTTMSPGQAQQPRFSKCGDWTGCLQFYCLFCHPPFVIWNDFCGYLLRLFCLHCKVFGPGRHLQMFGLHSAWWGHLGCYHKFFSHPSFPLLPVRNMEICLPITFSTTLGTKIYIHKTDFQIFFLDWYRLNGLLLLP